MYLLLLCFQFDLVVSLLNHSCTFYLSQEDIDKRKSKRAKHETIVGPAVDKSVAHEELQVIKKKNPVLQVNYSLFVDYYSLDEKSSVLSFFADAMVLFR